MSFDNSQLIGDGHGFKIQATHDIINRITAGEFHPFKVVDGKLAIDEDSEPFELALVGCKLIDAGAIIRGKFDTKLSNDVKKYSENCIRECKKCSYCVEFDNKAVYVDPGYYRPIEIETYKLNKNVSISYIIKVCGVKYIQKREIYKNMEFRKLTEESRKLD